MTELRVGVPLPRRENVVDDYHGVSVADPYRWMENLDDPELVAWLAAQERRTEELLDGTGVRERMRGLVAAAQGRRGPTVPLERGGRWFRLDDEGIGVAPRTDGPWTVVVPTPRPDATALIEEWSPSPDGRYVLRAEALGGSDWRTWYVCSSDDGTPVGTPAPDAKFWACWLPDSTGFLYITFSAGDGPGSAEGRTRATNVPELRLHRLDAAPGEADPVLFSDRARPRYFYPLVTSTGSHCVLLFLLGGDSEVVASPLDGSWTFSTVAVTPDDMWVVGDHDGDLIVATSDGAPYGRVVAIPLADPRREAWRTVVPEGEDPLRVVARTSVVGDSLLVVRDRLGQSLATVYPLDGTPSWEVDLLGPCQVVAHMEPAIPVENGAAALLAVTRPDRPLTVLRLEMRTRTTGVLATGPGVDDLDIDSEVVWGVSADGTRVPATLVGTRAALRNREAPVLVQGYGGGGDSMEPFAFVPWKEAWYRAGGVVASAHIRGGVELGARWQRAAERGGKLLAMQDFIACAEAVHERGTPVSRIAVTGRSSGAMLATAAVIHRPEAFGACVGEVGMFDVLRYHLFGLGRLMIAEYGTSEDPDDFRAMRAYSPLNNVQEGVTYPPMLLTVHTDDDRVAPGGPYKLAAELLNAAGGEAEVYLRLRAGAGHHGGTSEGEAAERGDILTFLLDALGAVPSVEATA